MMKCLLLTCAAPIALAAVPANAAVYAFNLTGAYTASFTIDSALLAPPAYADTSMFIVDFVAGTFGSVAGTADSISFSTVAYNGGLTLQLGSDFIDLWGTQLFTGTTAAPTVRTGTFALLRGGEATLPATLAISASAVPEPASWGMMIAGFGIAGYSLRRTRARVKLQTA